MPGHSTADITIQFQGIGEERSGEFPNHGWTVGQVKAVRRMIEPMAFGLPAILIFGCPGGAPFVSQTTAIIGMTGAANQAINFGTILELAGVFGQVNQNALMLKRSSG